MDIYAAANQMKLERKTIHDLKLKVTFYARVSTTREEQENSIEHQIAYFTEFIKKCENWTFIDGYVDRIRGESADNRVQFQNMIEDAKAGKFDLILTKEVSRFARNTIDSLTYTRDLLRVGVGVLFQNDNICTIDTDSELRLTIMSSIAADEVRKLSERVRWGHKRSIESGKVLGNNRIFGYDKVDCKLKINEEEAEMIKLIYSLYSTGDYSVRKIERILYEKGYRSRNNTRIHHNTVSGILKNPKYKGYYCGNKVKIIDYRTKEQRFLPEDEWIMHKDETGETVPAIVSEELWNKCNAIFTSRSTAIKSREHSFKDKSVFTGKIICSAHDRPYWRTSFSNSASKGQPVYQWICGEKRKFGTKTCASIAIKESELYNMLGNIFKGLADNLQDYIETFMQIYKETDYINKKSDEINQLKKALEKEKIKRDKLLELYMDDSISKAEFKERNTEYGYTINQLEESIASMESKNNDDKDYMKSMREIENYFKTMYNPELEMEKEQIDEMTKALIDKIYVIPINSTSMKIEIKLKTGNTESVNYLKTGKSTTCCSGHITFTIIPPTDPASLAVKSPL